jgi:hypothetical protein
MDLKLTSDEKQRINSFSKDRHPPKIIDKSKLGSSKGVHLNIRN